MKQPILILAIALTSLTAAVAQADGPTHVGVRFVTMYPFGGAASESDYASGLDVTYWHARHGLVFEPRLGFRLDPDYSRDGGWMSATADVGAYLMPRGQRAGLFVGGAGGLRVLSERTYETLRTGTVLVIEHQLLHADWTVGPAVSARVGFVSKPAEEDGVSRLVIALDVEAVYATLNGRSFPRSLQLSVGLAF
jgi:hypothetical protein